MVRQVYAGYSVAGRRINVPQVFIPRVIRTTIGARTVTNSKELNQLHFLAPVSPVVLADCVAVNALVDGWVNTQYHKLFGDTIQTEFIHSRSMEALVVPTATLPSSTAGLLTTDSLPFDVTLPCEWTTGLTGLENSGEFFPFTATETENDANGNPTLTYQLSVATVMANLISAAASAGYPLIIASYTYQKFTEVVSQVVRRQWGSQRRRLTQYGI